MQRLEVQPLELVVPAGQVDHQHLGIAPFGGEDFTDGGDVLDAADIGDQSPARTKLLECQLDDPADLPAGPANKHGIGRSESGPGLRRFAENGREIANAGKRG